MIKRKIALGIFVFFCIFYFVDSLTAFSLPVSGFPLSPSDFFFASTQATPEVAAALQETQAPSAVNIQSLLSVDTLTQKPLEELAGIYLGIDNADQVNAWLNNWNAFNRGIFGDAWDTIDIKNKQEELAFYIHLKPIVEELFPELTTQSKKDEKVEEFASLIKGGLEDKDLYEIGAFRKLYDRLATIQHPVFSFFQAFNQNKLEELINTGTYNSGEDKLTINAGISVLPAPDKVTDDRLRIEGDKRWYEVTTKLWIQFAPELCDLSRLKVINFNVALTTGQAEEFRPLLIVRLKDIVRLEDSASKIALARINFDSATTGEVSLGKEQFDTAEGFKWAEVGVIEFGFEYNIPRTSTSGFVNRILGDKVEILGFKIQKEVPALFSEPEDVKFFLEYLAPFKSWQLPQDENYIRSIADLTIGIDKQTIKKVIENVKSESYSLFVQKNLPEEINRIINKYSYPAFLKVRDISAFEEFNLPIIIDTERTIRELKNLGVDNNTLHLIELESLLRYLYRFEDKEPLPIKEGAMSYLESLSVLPEDMLCGIKRADVGSLPPDLGGTYSQELKQIVFNPLGQKWPDIKMDIGIIAHEFAHHLDIGILEGFEHYAVPSGGYADISNLFYKTQIYNKNINGIPDAGKIAEPVAYYFGDYVTNPLSSKWWARKEMQEGNFGPAISELITTYIIAFDKGCGLAYGDESDNLPLTFSEVRVAMEEAKSNGIEIPEILEEALNATELIFYKWRKDAGFEVENPVLSKYSGMDYGSLAERIKEDFPNFYPEVIAFGIDYIDALTREDTNFPEKLQGLKQIGFEIQCSFSLLGLGLEALEKKMPLTFNLLILGDLGEKIEDTLESDYLEDSPYVERMLERFLLCLENPDIDASIKSFICSYFADFLKREDLNPVLKEKASRRFNEIISKDAQIRSIYEKMLERDIEAVKTINRDYYGAGDMLEVSAQSLYLQSEAEKFLQNIKKLSKEEILALGASQDLSPEKLATEIILNFWSDLMAGGEVLREITQNSWQGFIRDLKMMTERVSWQIYKEILSKFEPETQISLPELPEGVSVTKAIDLPKAETEREIKELLEGLRQSQDYYYPEDYGFDDRWNDNGREYGSWNAFPEDYAQYCKDSPSDISFGGMGSSLRLDYDVESDNPEGAYNGLWMKLSHNSYGLDLSGYQALVLFIKGDEIAGYPGRIKISLEDKEWNKDKQQEILKGRSDFYIEGIGENWKVVIIPLEEFLKSGNLENLKSIDTLSITFEKDIVGNNAGTIYIDEIGFIKNGSLLEKILYGG